MTTRIPPTTTPASATTPYQPATRRMMTTDIPASITTPDAVETRLGTQLAQPAPDLARRELRLVAEPLPDGLLHGGGDPGSAEAAAPFTTRHDR